MGAPQQSMTTTADDSLQLPVLVIMVMLALTNPLLSCIQRASKAHCRFTAADALFLRATSCCRSAAAMTMRIMAIGPQEKRERWESQWCLKMEMSCILQQWCVCVCVHSARVRWHADHLAVSITSQWPSLNVENKVVEGKGEEDCSGHSLATA